MTSRYREAVEDTKRRLLITALKQHRTMRRAAHWLGISAATVCRDCKLLGIQVQTTTTVRVA